MNKKIIKIGIPILFLAGFLAIIILSQKEIADGAEYPIAPFDFTSFVTQYSDDHIKYKSPREAKEGYEKLYAIVCTEDSMTVTPSGSKLLRTTEADSCYALIFNDYFEIFKEDADNLFGSSTWDKNRRVEIKNSAEELLKHKGALPQQLDSLQNYITWVDGYEIAIDLINRKSKICTKATTYDNLLNEAKKYTDAPYCNNKELKTIINVVKNNAKEAWWNHLNSTVANIETECPKCLNKYGSYDDFRENCFNPIEQKINDFRYKFSEYSQKCHDLKTDLNDKSRTIRNCKNETPTKSNYLIGI